MHASNLLGNFGEGTVAQLLHRRMGGVHQFATRHLGEKAQLLDFIVNLLDEHGKEYGPFFFLQVRTTATIVRSKQGVRANFSAREVKLVQARKVPVYMAAVLDKVDGPEEIYVIGIDSRQTGGIAVVPRLFPLSEEAVRMIIYREVHEYFESGVKTFISELTRKSKGRGNGYF